MKVTGIAERAVCGVAASAANTVYNADGVRIRDYPLRQAAGADAELQMIGGAR